MAPFRAIYSNYKYALYAPILRKNLLKIFSRTFITLTLVDGNSMGIFNLRLAQLNIGVGWHDDRIEPHPDGRLYLVHRYQVGILDHLHFREVKHRLQELALDRQNGFHGDVVVH